MPAGGWVAKVSIAGPEVAERRQQLGGLRLGQQRHRLDDDEVFAAQRVGHLRQRREGHQPADRGHLVGRGRGPLVPGVEDLARPLDREEERPGEDLRDRQQLELQRGDDAEVPAAAAQGPEELGVGSRRRRAVRSRSRRPARSR